MDDTILSGVQEYKIVIKIEDAEGLSCRSIGLPCARNAVGNTYITIQTLENNENPLLSEKTMNIQENSGVVSKIVVTNGVAKAEMKFPRNTSYAAEEYVYIYRYDNPLELAGMKLILPYPAPTDITFYFEISDAVNNGIYEGGMCSTIILHHNYAIDHDLKCGVGDQVCDEACDVSSHACVCNQNSCLYPLLTYQIMYDEVIPSIARPYFQINASSGKLWATQAFDFESNLGLLSTWNKQFIVPLAVTDNSGLSSTSRVIVNVVDVPEKPTILAVAFDVNENLPLNSYIGTVLASDEDANDVGNLLLFLDSPNFSIQMVEGQVSLSRILNYELKSTYIAEVTVEDSFGMASFAPLKVILQNINEQPSIESSFFSIEENAILGTEVGRIKAFDPDFSSVLSYSTLQNNFFSIKPAMDNQYIAVLEVKSGLDYEIQAVHTCSVLVSDGFLSTSATTTIYLLDANDIEVHSIDIFDDNGNHIQHGMSTVGNEVVRIRGSNLAYVGKNNDISIKLTNAPEASPNVAFEGYLTNCMITGSFGKGNEEVICRSPEGHGNLLSMELEIFRPDSIGNKWFFALNYLQTGLGYSKPSINFVYSPNGTTLRTQGQEEMVVVGKNFGPAMSPVVNVEYGPAGVGICALDCEVVTSHTHVKCMTNTGVGKNHRFIISVGYDRHSIVSLATMSYTPPTVYSVSVPNKRLDTRGTTDVEENIHIYGNNFGPAARTFSGCFGLSSITLPTVTGVYSNSFLQYNLECWIVIDDIEIECSGSPGVGKNLTINIFSGGQSTTNTGSNPKNRTSISYFTPSVSAISGAGSREASTSGGQTVSIDGNYFGPMKTPSSLITVTYGKYPDAWDSSSYFFPPYVAACTIFAAHAQLVCTTSPGTGKNHSWQVTIAGQSSPFVHFGTSYGAPIIFTLDDITYMPMNSGLTIGGETVVITGRNFGPLAIPEKSRIQATYGGKKGESEITFFASKCNVTVPHTEIRCFSGEGAGAQQPWTIVVDGQTSISPSVSYGTPKIFSLSGIGSFQANGNGGELVIINGVNFGPPEIPEFFQGVTYGESGVEYKANCTHVSHTELHCITAPGIGNDLYWKVNVEGQTNILDANAKSSYAAPWVLDFPTLVDTDLSTETPQRLTGTNLGVSDKLADIVLLQYHSDSIVSLEIVSTSLLENGNHEVYFVVPHLECNSCTSTFKLVVLVKSPSGKAQMSGGDTEQEIYISYNDPILLYIHVADGVSGNSRRLTLMGENFGATGTVFRHLTIHDETPIPQIGNSVPTTNSYVLSYSHKKIVIEYGGTTGSLSVKRARKQVSYYNIRNCDLPILLTIWFLILTRLHECLSVSYPHRLFVTGMVLGHYTLGPIRYLHLSN